jgi:peptidase E
VPASQPTIVATSIGFSGTGDVLRCGPAYAEALRLSRAARRPRLCIVATAVGDNPAVLALLYAAFARLDVSVSHLALFPMPNVEDIRGHLLDQDLIWVCGGSSANLLTLWRLHGVDTVMRECWQAGVVLMGVSAGSLCWHVGGTTDSFGLQLQPITNALGFLPYSNSPHHDGEEQRRPLIHQLIGDGALPDGYATDNGAGLVYFGTDLHEVISERADAYGYQITRRPEGGVHERRLPTRVL